MDTGLYLRNMKEKDEDWCEALLKHENYALVVDSITFESCLHALWVKLYLQITLLLDYKKVTIFFLIT